MVALKLTFDQRLLPVELAPGMGVLAADLPDRRCLSTPGSKGRTA